MRSKKAALMISKLKLTDEKGVAAIVVAIVMITLLMSLGLVVDIGRDYQVRRQLQTAADAAALAGAIDLAKDQSQDVALATAQSYANKNFSSGFDNLDITFPGAKTVDVTVKKAEPTFFAGILGQNSVQVAAHAVAGGQLLTTVYEGVVPIIMPFQTIDAIGPNQESTFNLAGDTDGPQQGLFWLVNFSGPGAGTPDYADWIEDGYPDPVSIGDTAAGTGMKAALKSALDERLGEHPKMIVPVYDDTQDTGGSKTYNVVGFAEFVLTDFQLTGNPKTISGYFTTGRMVKGSSDGSATHDYGIVTVNLSQ